MKSCGTNDLISHKKKSWASAGSDFKTTSEKWKELLGTVPVSRTKGGGNCGNWLRAQKAELNLINPWVPEESGMTEWLRTTQHNYKQKVIELRQKLTEIVL